MFYNFFGQGHATPAHCYWHGVYFHGKAEDLVSQATRHLPGTSWAAPDLVACALPLEALVLGEGQRGGIRPILRTVQCRYETPPHGEPCAVYGQLAKLFLWLQRAGEPDARFSGLIVLHDDVEAVDYAERHAKARSMTL